MTTLYCGQCGGRFDPDDDHVWVDAETKWMDDRSNIDKFAFHVECWDRLSSDWADPA